MVTTLHTPPFNWLASGMRIARSRNINLVAVSNSIRHQWANVVSVPEVVLNGVDLSNFRFHHRPSEEPYLVWYGRIVAEKGLHYAIDAARMMGMSLRFAGPISGSQVFCDRDRATPWERHALCGPPLSQRSL
jgi:glycosyltransferase involved in cell wall biosynthesis